MHEIEVDVLIVGAGPAGLAAAIELKECGVPKVLVLDRDTEAGGTPRFCHHTGFGVRDLHGFYSGPGYAKHYAKRAASSGAEIWLESTATEWVDERTLAVTNPMGIHEVTAKAVLLATGCRERPRSARLVPGDRPNGIFTTGSLQDTIHRYHQSVGRDFVVDGAELVSFSALLTLMKAKSRAVLMVTEQPKHQAYGIYRPFKWWTTGILMDVPIATKSKVTRIIGCKNVEAVEVTNLNSGAQDIVQCDGVVFTGDWIPDHELARKGGLAIDANTKGPAVDAAFRTSKMGIFAAGNLLRGAETADHAALEGRLAAQSICKYLTSEQWPEQRLAIQAQSPVAWVSPNVVNAESVGAAPRDLLFRVQEVCRRATVTVAQGEKVLHRKHYRKIGPNLSLRLRDGWLQRVEANGPAIDVRIEMS